MIITIEKLSSEGSGIARANGLVLFIPFTVPGDTVEAEITRQYPKYAEAKVVRLITASPDRITPPCPYFYECGGCQLQHMNYATQLASKKQIVMDALKRIGKVNDVIVPDVTPSPKEFFYRSRIQLQQSQTGKIGFFKRNTHDIVEIKKCLIADEKINEQLENIKNIPDNRFELKTDPTSGFTQINILQNNNLVQTVLDYLDPKPEDLVADVYCGSGNFTFPISEKAKHVWAIERDIKSLKEGKKKKTSNISWIKATSSEGLRKLRKMDSVVVDPPREGMDKETLNALIDLHPKKIISVSCNPSTFARDAERLIQKGYQLTKVQPLDMFPQTSHVEIVGLFILSS